MKLPINKPTILATSASSFNSVTVTACPDPDTTAGPNFESVTINDSATFGGANDGNVLWSCPFAALFENVLYKGPVAGSGATSNGLVVSEMPPGVAIVVDFWELTMARTARDYLVDDVRRLSDRATLLADHGPPDPEVTGDFAASVDGIYREFGSSAPLPLRSESPRGYELRVLSELQKQIPNHKPIPLSALASIPDEAFRQQRDVIVSAARAAAQSHAPPGTLRERRVNHEGLVCTEFAGDPSVWLSHFVRPGFAVKRFRNSSGQTINPNRRTVG